MMSEPEGFRDFWGLYPRRVAKQDAIDAYRRINPDLDLRSRINLELRWQVENTWRDTPVDKIPYPATWLNGKRWEDERQIPLPRNGHPPARNFTTEVNDQAVQGFLALKARMRGER